LHSRARPPPGRLERDRRAMGDRHLRAAAAFADSAPGREDITPCARARNVLATSKTIAETMDSLQATYCSRGTIAPFDALTRTRARAKTESTATDDTWAISSTCLSIGVDSRSGRAIESHGRGGIGIGKIQISAARSGTLQPEEHRRATPRHDDVYLHQVVESRRRR